MGNVKQAPGAQLSGNGTVWLLHERRVVEGGVCPCCIRSRAADTHQKNAPLGRGGRKSCVGERGWRRDDARLTVCLEIRST